MNLDHMKMSSYVVIYPNIVGISLGHKYGLERTVVANELSILAKNDACLLLERNPKIVSMRQLIQLIGEYMHNFTSFEPSVRPGSWVWFEIRLHIL